MHLVCHFASSTGFIISVVVFSVFAVPRLQIGCLLSFRSRVDILIKGIVTVLLSVRVTWLRKVEKVRCDQTQVDGRGKGKE
ncbi:hypothetical protein BX666DRAFT_1151037 [Dichotomocladium elegans]|nr:hypothetical protein BX666DRAFT_1151037 [Dichotomocladium elegans]